MKKIASIFLAALFAVSMLTSTALASGTEQYVKFVQVEETADGLTVSIPAQYWTYTRSITNGMVISGGGATMCTKIETYANYYQSAKISVTSTLQRLSGGKWVNVGSYSGSGTGYCLYENNVSLSANQTYRVVTTGTTSYGGTTENITATSKIYYT